MITADIAESYSGEKSPLGFIILVITFSLVGRKSIFRSGGKKKKKISDTNAIFDGFLDSSYMLCARIYLVLP